jgi:hypothetical protein
MDKKLFERLVESMQQHEDIRRGVRAPSREFFVDAEPGEGNPCHDGAQPVGSSRGFWTWTSERYAIGNRDGANRQLEPCKHFRENVLLPGGKLLGKPSLSRRPRICV